MQNTGTQFAKRQMKPVQTAEIENLLRATDARCCAATEVFSVDEANVASFALSPEQVVLRAHIEATLVHIWCTLLDLKTVDIEDNFLLLGGESLLATQMAVRIRDHFGVDLPIRTIFVGTLGELAQLVLQQCNALSLQLQCCRAMLANDFTYSSVPNHG